MVNNKLPLYCSPREWDYLRGICPHRGASLFFGRSEEGGLRCVYHGRKFDATGTCVDMPNEPAEGSFKNKIRQTAYRTREAGGVICVHGPSSDDARAAAARVDAEERDTLRMRGWILSFDFLCNPGARLWLSSSPLIRLRPK